VWSSQPQHVFPSLCLHVSTWLPLDGFSCNFILETFIKISRKSVFGYSQTKISGTSREYLSMSILLTVVQNIFYLNSVMGICCYIPVAMPNTVDSRMWLNNTKGMHYFIFMVVTFDICYVVDSDIFISTVHKTRCCISKATVIM
jgi:hypothetical protein